MFRTTFRKTIPSVLRRTATIPIQEEDCEQKYYCMLLYDKFRVRDVNRMEQLNKWITEGNGGVRMSPLIPEEVEELERMEAEEREEAEAIMMASNLEKKRRQELLCKKERQKKRELTEDHLTRLAKLQKKNSR